MKNTDIRSKISTIFTICWNSEILERQCFQIYNQNPPDKLCPLIGGLRNVEHLPIPSSLIAPLSLAVSSHGRCNSVKDDLDSAGNERSTYPGLFVVKMP